MSKVIRFLAQHPDHPWWKISQILVSELLPDRMGTGAPREESYMALDGCEFSIVTPRHALGAVLNPESVHGDPAAVGMTTPSTTAKLAFDGRAPFQHGHPGLRAIASYAHDDVLLFAAEASSGGPLTLRRFLTEERPTRVVTGRRDPDGREDVLTHCVRRVMERHGAGFDAYEVRGGEIVYGGPTRTAGTFLLDRTADALFHEAQGNPIWGEIARARDISLLDLEDEFIDDLAEELELRIRLLDTGHQVENTIPYRTLDFSDWLLFVDESMPDEWAYALAHACDRTRSAVESAIPGAALTTPLEGPTMFGSTPIPLHDGARTYAAKAGYLTDL